MKKKLIAIIVCLCLVTLTLGGVSYAYFSVDDDGGDQNFSIAHFSFAVDRADTSGTVLSKTAPITFRAPTVINFPRLEAPAAGTVDPVFNAYGDDANFNAYCLPIAFTVDNRCDYAVTVRLSAVAQAVSGVDLTAAVRYFPLEHDAVSDGDYAAALYAAIPAVEGVAGTPDVVSEAARTAALETAVFTLAARPSAETASQGKYVLVAWLDYHAMRAVTGDAAAIGNNMTVDFRVEVSQVTGGAA